MLVIRLQRTGRKGHAQFRVVVQDSRRTPTSGRVVALLGSYNPHTKTVILDKEKAALYLSNGAQPSDRVVRLLQAEIVALPAWVKVSVPQTGKIRNPEKLRRNQPVEEAAPAEVEAPVEEAPVEEVAAAEEAPAVEAEAPAEETPAETEATETEEKEA
jgi:small subunit ribosomal protein S16